MMEPNAAVKNEILAIEQRWVQAHRELDVDAIEQILSDDFQQIEPEGRVTGKADLLDSYRSGTRRWDLAESDEYRMIGNEHLVVLIGRWRGRGENDGERFDYSARFTAVYVRHESGWKLAAECSIPIQP